MFITSSGKRKSVRSVFLSDPSTTADFTPESLRHDLRAHALMISQWPMIRRIPVSGFPASVSERLDSVHDIAFLESR